MKRIFKSLEDYLKIQKIDISCEDDDCTRHVCVGCTRDGNIVICKELQIEGMKE